MIKAKKLNIAVFADFLTEVGGVEYYIYQLATSLKKAGCDVRVLTGVKPENNYWVEKLNKKDISVTFSDLTYVDRKDRNPERKLLEQFKKDFTEWKPDIIQTCPMGKLFKVWVEFEESKNVPIIGTEMTTPGPDTRHWYSPDLFEKINRLSAVIAWGKASKAGVENFLAYKGKTYLIPHFIPNPSNKIKFVTTSSKNDQSIGCICRLSPEKGAEYLIAAMHFVIKKYPNATLHIYGAGRDEEHLKYVTKCFGIDKNVFFEGTYPPVSGIDSVSQKHNIFVQPSLFEGMSVVMLELIARKRAIIATKVGGNPELFAKSKAAILVDRGDTKGLANKIMYLLRNPKRQVELSKNAYKLYEEKYLKASPLQKHLEVYQEAIKNFKLS